MTFQNLLDVDVRIEEGGPPVCPICEKIFHVRPSQINGTIVCASCFGLAMKLERLLAIVKR